MSIMMRWVTSEIVNVLSQLDDCEISINDIGKFHTEIVDKYYSGIVSTIVVVRRKGFEKEAVYVFAMNEEEQIEDRDNFEPDNFLFGSNLKTEYIYYEASNREMLLMGRVGCLLEENGYRFERRGLNYGM
jgi:hypothetical protein